MSAILLTIAASLLTPQGEFGPPTVYDVLQAKCFSCHGPEKQKGGLRLDVVSDLADVVEAGEVTESELARRILLPRKHDDVMPPKEELTDAELLAVLSWIRDGADMKAITEPGAGAAADALANAEALAAVERASGAVLRSVAGERGLRADFARRETPPLAGALQALASIQNRVTEIDLSGQRFGADFIDGLPDFSALRRLHLERSNITDAALQRLLAVTPRLEYLNVHSTAITDASLRAIRELPELRRLVLFGTNVTDKARMNFARRHRDTHVSGGLALPLPLDPKKLQRRILAADASKKRIALLREKAIDNYEVEWEHPIRQIHDLQVLANGHILFQETWTKLLEVDPESKKTVWTYDAALQNREGAPGPVEVHSFGRLPNGDTFVAESGPSRILEVDRDGTLRHVIPLHVDRSRPHHDTRLVRRTDAETYLVAHEAEGVVREYARDGSVVWSYDVPLFDRPRKGGHGPEAWGNQLFSAQRLPNGNTLIGTGNGHRVIEVTPRKEIVWQLTEDDVPGIDLAWITTVQVLRSGNLLIGNCHAGPLEPQIFEITREKDVAWTYRDFERFGNSLSNSFILEDER